MRRLVLPSTLCTSFIHFRLLCYSPGNEATKIYIFRLLCDKLAVRVGQNILWHISLICSINIIESRRAIKNGQSRNTGNTVHTGHRTKTNKTHTHKATQKTRMLSKKEISKLGDKHRASRRVSSS